jgi:dihydroxy-acid dehydratase
VSDRRTIQRRVKHPLVPICEDDVTDLCRSHGFCIGHVVPEAQDGGPIALVRDGDLISVDAVQNTVELHVSPQELDARRSAWMAPPLKVTQGTLYKYVKAVQDASHGCITDQ